MLGILKVNAGISFEGVAEFTLTIADAKDQVYEVQIDDIAYAQLLDVIEETTKTATEETRPKETNNGSNGSKLASLSPEKRVALANLLTQQNSEIEPRKLPSSPIGLADVGFDYDYSANEEEDDDDDPGEIFDDEEYVEPI